MFRERALEEQVADTIAKEGNETLVDASGAEVGGDGSLDKILGATSSSLESVKGGESIMEALDLIAQEPQLGGGGGGGDDAVSTNPLMLGLTAHKYMLLVLRRIAVPELENSLLVLPFHYVVRLLAVLIQVRRTVLHSSSPVYSTPLKKRILISLFLFTPLLQLAEKGLDVELCCRCSVHLLRCHQSALLQSNSAALQVPQMLSRLHSVLGSSISSYRDMVGTNLAGLRHLRRKQLEIEENNKSIF